MSITSLQALAGQLHVFRSHPPAVSEESDLYITDTVTTVGQETHRTLTGILLTIDAKEDARLYKSLHFSSNAGIDPAKTVSVALNQLTIVCDHLVIGSPLWIPECSVIIYARKLTIKPGAYIKTDPQSWTKPAGTDAVNTGTSPKKGEDGKNGRKAGDIAIWVREFDGPDAKKPEEAWFRAVGGKGQNPGQGKNGEPGYSIKASGFPATSYKISLETDFLVTKFKNSWSLTFKDNPASFFKVRYRKLEIPQPHLDESYGDSNWPTHGSDALESGRPGEPGQAGRFVSNQRFNTQKNSKPDVVRVVSMSGERGDAGKATTGGAPGQPTTCAHYELTLWKNMGDADNLTWRSESVTVNPNAPTRQGRSFPEKTTSSPGSIASDPVVKGPANAWLHPLLLQKALIFFRDLYLAEQFDLLREYLKDYTAALREEMPENHERSEWNPLNKSEWMAGKMEIATMQLRLQNQLDYFGHRPGYMPIWSLQGALKRYENESEATLRTLLLTRWIAKVSAAKKDVNQAAATALTQIDSKTALVAAQVKTAEEKLAEFNKQMDAMFREQDRIVKKVEGLRTELLIKVKGQAELEAAVKMGLKVVSALCYVIPVGQPFLGAGASVATDLVEKIAFSDKEGTDIAADTLSKASSQWKDSWKEYKKSGEDSEKEAKAAGKEAEEAAKRDKTDFSQKDWQAAYDKSAQKSSKWGQVADGAGSALSKLSEGMAGLQVPESAIEAKLNKVLEKNDEFKELSKSLKGLLEKKKQLSEDLVQELVEINTGYAQLATLASASVNWHQQRTEASSVLSPALDAFNSQMDQQARISLLNALYEVVKAYETTLFKNPKAPNKFDWKLDVIFDKVETLLKVDQTPEKLLAQVEVLKKLFDKNIENVLKWLSEDYGVGEALSFPLEYRLSGTKLKKLQQEPVTIDTMRKGLVPPDRERAFLTNIDLSKEDISFADPKPTSGNAIITLRASDEGIVRSGARLYGVYRESVKEWIWTYTFGNGKLTQAHRTEQAEDLLKMMLKGERLHQQLASPPAWSDLTLSISYTGISGTRPPITNLRFSSVVDSNPAAKNEMTLELRCDDPEVQLNVDPADSGGIDNGKTQIFGIYRKGTEVELSTSLRRQVDWEVPEDLQVSVEKNGEWAEVEGEIREIAPERKARFVKARSIKIVMKDHHRIRCKTLKS